ncbi:MAG TPA: septal ring lytic transglycosylase RlpA family protein [Bryobacteraceae bacterium]|nr:septal ring lytic transglycosylase RlpA family protein [Bryobacteraceae bacterium]
MATRARFAALAFPLGFIVLSGCGKKHHRIATPATPSVPAAIGSTETGIASWYGHPYHGRAAANGEIYDMEKLTAAHRTLPFGTMVRVTNLTNGKTVDVRIIDRGPFVAGRIIDLSHAAAQEIEMIGPGVAQVRLDILALQPVMASENWYAVQAGAFQDKDRAERLRVSMEQQHGTARLVLRKGYPTLWRVLVGKEHTEDSANVLADQIRREVGTGFVVRLDEPAASPITGSPTSGPQQ